MDADKIYEKLASHYGVRPSVYAIDDNGFNSYFAKSRIHVFFTILSSGAITKRNYMVLKAVCRAKNTDGYILMDAEQPQDCIFIVLSHEFVHAKQNKHGQFITEIHNMRELEADILSTDFLIKNSIDAVASFNEFKKYIFGLSKTKKLLQATVILRIGVFFLIIWGITKLTELIK